MNLLPHIEVITQKNPNASIIWLHGLGANGHDFEPIVKELHLPANAAFRFIFPHAPSIAVTINGGYVMPAWYDILKMDIDRDVDEIQLKNSSAAINDFIRNEVARGINSERIIIAGFSQGGAVAFETALTYPQKLGGLMAMSTYFATAKSIEFNSANQSIPVLIQHGTHDPVVPVILSDVSSTLLEQKGYQVEKQLYPMEHSVCPQQIKDISSWLQKILL